MSPQSKTRFYTYVQNTQGYNGNIMFYRSSSSMGKKEMDLVTPLRHGGNSHRQFILEGHVEFAQVIIILYRCM